MSLLLNIDVPDLRAAELFYTRAFGLGVGRRFGDDFLELLGWPIPVDLLRKGAGTIAAAADHRRYDRHWTPIHVDIVVGDLDAALVLALDAGARLERHPRRAPYGRLALLGCWPMLSGVRPRTFDARIAMNTISPELTRVAASGKPIAAISATQSGEKTTPPMLAPLYPEGRHERPCPRDPPRRGSRLQSCAPARRPRPPRRIRAVPASRHGTDPGGSVATPQEGSAGGGSAI